MSELAVSYFTMIFVLGLVLTLLYFIMKLLKNKVQAIQKGKRLEVLESLGLNQKTQLVIVRVDDEEHLLGYGDHGVQHIKTLKARSFEELLLKEESYE